MRGTARLLVMLWIPLAIGVVTAADPGPKREQAMMPPRLGKPLPDRAPIADPAKDISTAAVLKAPMPPRKGPFPYLAENLPDPFERWETVKLRRALKEEATPPIRFLPLPKR